MKYTAETTIDLPRQKVVALFDDPENLKKWQPELVSFEPVSGTPGQPGAKSRLLYRMGGRTIEMIETITRRDLPDEFSGTYEAKGVFNTITNRFFAEGSRTRWQVETEFRCSGLMKFMAALMPGAFKKQTAKFMRNFKEFAEGEGNRAAAETR